MRKNLVQDDVITKLFFLCFTFIYPHHEHINKKEGKVCIILRKRVNFTQKERVNA